MGIMDMLSGVLGGRKRSSSSGGAVPAGMPDLGSLGSVLGGGGQAGMLAMLLPALLGSGALAKLGGLPGILGRLQGAGLGDKADSWVATGANAAIHPDEVETALGSDTIAEVAREAGVSHEEAAGGLAALLPRLVDRSTPHGSVPDRNELSGLLAKLDPTSLLD